MTPFLSSSLLVLFSTQNYAPMHPNEHLYMVHGFSMLTHSTSAIINVLGGVSVRPRIYIRHFFLHISTDNTEYKYS